MIANCPGCGTHYRHEPPKVRVRARCGRCATSLDLGRLSPYRIVAVVAPTKEQLRIAADHLPIGLDHPALATTIAENVSRKSTAAVAQPVPVLMPVPAPVLASVDSTEIWENEDPLPPIPEMALRGDYDSSVRPAHRGEVTQEGPEQDVDEIASEDGKPLETTADGGRTATIALWLAAGAIAGTGASWTLGGTTIIGVAAGAGFGAVAGWMWLRWTSPK